MQSTQINVEALARAGVAALQRGDVAGARAAFEQVTTAGRATPQLWLLLGQACDQLDDRPAAHHALDQVLATDPRNPFALLLKGDLLLRGDDDRGAVAYYRAAIRATQGLETFPGDLRARLARAQAAVERSEARFQAHLRAKILETGVDRLPPRFSEALGIASGVRQPWFQQPTNFFYPGLPHIAFYEAEQFPWAAAMEEAAPAMRAEIEAVLAEDRNIGPYVVKPENRPSREHSLLNDARWSAFHLWKDGKLVEENASRCPTIMQLLATAPIPVIKHRSPMALISILKPGTHIPPHNGMLNTRLICHIPLVVPAGCRLRVGGETRTVEAGKAMIFDDSIEHEAWNDGESVRAVLLFEVWRPELSEDERIALTAMFEAVTTYGPTSPPNA